MIRFATMHDYPYISALINKCKNPSRFSPLTTFIITTTSKVNSFSNYHIVVFEEDTTSELQACMLIDTSPAILRGEQVCISDEVNHESVLVAFHTFLNDYAEEHGFLGFSVTLNKKAYELDYIKFAKPSDRYVDMYRNTDISLAADKCKVSVYKHFGHTVFDTEAKNIREFAIRERKGLIAANTIETDGIISLYNFHYGVSEEAGKESSKDLNKFISFLLNVTPSDYLRDVRVTQLFCFYNKACAGYAVVNEGAFNNRSLNILDYYILPNYINTEVPTLFAKHLVEVARKNSNDYIITKCITGNRGSLFDIYKQAGFSVFGVTLVFTFNKVNSTGSEVGKTKIF